MCYTCAPLLCTLQLHALCYCLLAAACSMSPSPCTCIATLPPPLQLHTLCHCVPYSCTATSLPPCSCTATSPPSCSCIHHITAACTCCPPHSCTCHITMCLAAWPCHCLPHSHTHHHPSPICMGHVTAYTTLLPLLQPHMPCCCMPYYCMGHIAPLTAIYIVLPCILLLHRPHCLPCSYTHHIAMHLIAVWAMSPPYSHTCRVAACLAAAWPHYCLPYSHTHHYPHYSHICHIAACLIFA